MRFLIAIALCAAAHAQNSPFQQNQLEAIPTQKAVYGHAENGALLPDQRLTPGDVLTVPLTTLCQDKYTTTVRDVPASLKRQVYKEYGAAPKYIVRKGKRVMICCEVDHLISLELGGSNNIRNLWPEPYEPLPGARQKDVVENALHKLVCQPHPVVTLAEAQKAIATNWTTAITVVIPRDSAVLTATPTGLKVSADSNPLPLWPPGEPIDTRPVAGIVLDDKLFEIWIGSKTILQIRPGGIVTYGEGVTPNEAARTFAEAMHKQLLDIFGEAK